MTVADLTQELLKAQRDKIEALLGDLPPGYRLCLHSDQRVYAGFEGDAFLVRIEQGAHLLNREQHCAHQGPRTEYVALTTMEKPA